MFYFRDDDNYELPSTDYPGRFDDLDAAAAADDDMEVQMPPQKSGRELIEEQLRQKSMLLNTRVLLVKKRLHLL